MERRHAWIPDVKQILQKMKGFKYYSDFDMTNSFHQIRLDKLSSERLTIITPKGPLRPLYMPEGIKCATPILHNTVSKIFADFISQQWMVVLFDNFVIAGNSKQQLTQRTYAVFERCREYNLRLKLTKSHFGTTKVEFFGYEVDGEGYRLQPDKTQHIVARVSLTSLTSLFSHIPYHEYIRTYIICIHSIHIYSTTIPYP